MIFEDLGQLFLGDVLPPFSFFSLSRVGGHFFFMFHIVMSLLQLGLVTYLFSILLAWGYESWKQLTAIVWTDCIIADILHILTALLPSQQLRLQSDNICVHGGKWRPIDCLHQGPLILKNLYHWLALVFQNFVLEIERGIDNLLVWLPTHLIVHTMQQVFLSYCDFVGRFGGGWRGFHLRDAKRRAMRGRFMLELASDGGTLRVL